MQTSAGHNTVDLGIEYNTHATAAWLALHLGLFEKHGIHVGKIVKFRTGLELAAAFSHGDIDAAWACLAPIVKMIDMGARIYIVNAAHYYGYGCVGRPGIESLAQLRGMRHVRVAVPGNGAPTHILALLAAEKYGLNISIVFIKPPAILSAVLKGDVDMACLPEHYLSIAESKGLHVILLAQNVWPGMPGSYLVVSERLLRENPQAVCELAKVNREATEYALAHPDYAAKIDSVELGIPEDIALKSIKRLELTWRLNLADMQRLADIMYRYGIIKSRINIANYVINVSEICR